jgi:dipeptidyl aminopeptidase/acylaminoacyl peptidase
MATVTADPIPRRVFFGNPQRLSVQISPDGSLLGWLAPLEGVLNVWVAPLVDPSRARAVTRDAGRGIRSWLWTQKPGALIYYQDHDGDENTHLYLVDLNTAAARDLTPGAGILARIQEVSPLHPEQILIALNDRDPSAHDLYRVDLSTGERRLALKNQDGFLAFVTDAHLQVRLAVRMTEEGGKEILRSDGAGGWTEFLRIAPEDQLTTRALAFDRSGELLYLLSSIDRNTSALCAVDWSTGAWTMLAADELADVDDVLLDARTDRPLAASSSRLRQRWEVLDEGARADLEFLQTIADAEVHVPSQSADGNLWVVGLISDLAPVRYCLYRRTTRELRNLFSSRPELDGLPLARKHPVVLKTRDGLEMVCYYTIPAGATGPSGNRPRTPSPLVLHVHGGPWGRDGWTFDPFDQWMANRGYAVMTVNFRGSTGFGKAFVNAGDREWAGRMHDDLLDAVDWAVREGIADPKRVAIYGVSYGGYAALVGLTFSPEVFACGVSMVGPSNLVTLLETMPPYWKPILRMFTTRMADPSTPEGRAWLKSRSPLTRADRISRPLLIGQGANDPRVKRAEADQIVSALKQKGIPVTYLLYTDEGHGLARPENRMSFLAVVEAFLARGLGGRVEPVGDAFQGAKVRVLEGEDLLPELSAYSGR